METGWSLADTGVSPPYQWSPNVSHISQSNPGVRLTSAVTSSRWNHVTWECVEVQFPPRTSAQFCCYKKKKKKKKKNPKVLIAADACRGAAWVWHSVERRLKEHRGQAELRAEQEVRTQRTLTLIHSSLNQDAFSVEIESVCFFLWSLGGFLPGVLKSRKLK